VFGKLDINLPDLVGKLFPTDGNTSYEELVCAGLNPSENALVGVIRVKFVIGLFRRTVHRWQPGIRHFLGRLQQRRDIRDLLGHGLG
jgi:hypothetical protein